VFCKKSAQATENKGNEDKKDAPRVAKSAQATEILGLNRAERKKTECKNGMHSIEITGLRIPRIAGYINS
jgi:hypothetical protein